MSIYVVLNSDRNLKLHETNKPYCFQTYFHTPLYLKGLWKVALVDFAFANDEPTTVDHLYVHCNECTGMVVDGEVQSVLRRIVFNGQTPQIFNSPLYVDVINNEITNLEIVIRNREGNLASFLTNPLSLTLHFKAYPFSI